MLLNYDKTPQKLRTNNLIVFLDTATITVNYQGYSMTYSDSNNPIFPSPQQISILVGTTDVILTCSLSECIWDISNEASVITMQNYTILTITDSYNVDISLMRMTDADVNYTTAHISIISMRTQPSIVLVAVVILVLIMVIILAAIAILIPLSIYFYMKKRKTNKRPKPSVLSKDGFPGYENLSELHSPSKEYLDLPANSNPQYMTIDETSMIPLESENEQKHREYANFNNESTYANTYEQINEINMKTDIELNPIVPYENYVPMSPVKEEKRFVPKSIPTKEFPATNKQYVASGIGKDSLFSLEFTNLNEEAKIRFETDEALKVENTSKNPIKDIIPFDENRIVLNSPYFDCNYINASYVNDYQFIATIHPTKETYRDFLQMIYQTRASMVIMLTTRKEKAKITSGISNRVCYWPKKNEPTNCEPFETALITSTETNAFIKQEISVKNTLESKEHTFIHCISPIWNEDSTVTDMTPILVLLNRILNQIKEDSSKSIIIHCQDGVSKTGILLSGINSVKELTHKKSINIFNSVKNLRRQRMKMLPTLVSNLNRNTVQFMFVFFIYDKLVQMLVKLTHINATLR